MTTTITTPGVEKHNIDSVIFDIGNVLIPFNPRWLFRKLLPSEASIEQFFVETGFDAWNLEMDAGLPFADGIAAHSARFPQYRALFAAFFERWNETVGDPIVESIEILRALKQRGIRTYALTNFSAETFPLALARFPFLSEFDGTMVSGKEKLVKPDPAIYRLLLQRHGITAERAVFIDDRLENVEAARQLGLYGIHFTDATQLRESLLRLNLPVGRD